MAKVNGVSLGFVRVRDTIIIYQGFRILNYEFLLFVKKALQGQVCCDAASKSVPWPVQQQDCERRIQAMVFSLVLRQDRSYPICMA